MGNETTAGTVAGLAPVAVLIEGLAKYFAPGPVAEIPAGTIAAAFLSLLAYVMPVGRVILAKALGTSVLALALGMGLGGMLSGCSVFKGGGTESVVNVCTTAGRVYEPVQIAMLAAIRSGRLDGGAVEKVGAADRAATGALGDCLAAVEAGNNDGAAVAVGALSAATARAMAALVETGVVETSPDAATTEVQ